MDHLGGLNAMIHGCLSNEEYLKQNCVYTEEKYCETEKFLTCKDDGIEDRKDKPGVGLVPLTLLDTNTDEFDKQLKKSSIVHIPKFGAVLIYCSIILSIFILTFAFDSGVTILIMSLFCQWIISVYFALMRWSSISASRIINRKIDVFDSNMIFAYNMFQIYNLAMQSISQCSGIRGSTLYYIMSTNTALVVAALLTICLYKGSNGIINDKDKLSNIKALVLYQVIYFELNGHNKLHSKLYATIHYVGIGLCGYYYEIKYYIFG